VADQFPGGGEVATVLKTIATLGHPLHNQPLMSSLSMTVPAHHIAHGNLNPQLLLTELPYLPAVA
jgi:hypothetical protein